MERWSAGCEARPAPGAREGEDRNAAPRQLAGRVWDDLSGRHLAFAVILNHHTVANREATTAIDEICETLARQ